MAEQEKWISVVEGLIGMCHDSQEVYAQAAQNAQAPELRELFNDVCDERRLFARELEDRVNQLGEHGEMPATSVAGALHLAWMSLKDKLGGGDNAILSSVESAEAAAFGEYENALKRNLPPGIEETVRAQMQSIVATRDQLKRMQDQRRAA